MPMRPTRLAGGFAKGALVLCVVIAGLCPRSACAAPINDNQDSFNSYVMTAPLSQYPSLKLVKTWSAEMVKEVGFYENPGEAVMVNGVSLTGIRYRFADQRLESIYATYEGRENRDRLMRWLEEQYGKLAPVERRIVNQVEWRGDRMVITLDFDIYTKRGSLWFISPELNHLLNDSSASLPN